MKRTRLPFWRLENWQSVLLIFAITNLPLLLTCLFYWGSDSLPMMLKLYPGQFAFLGLVFPFVTIFTHLCGKKLLEADQHGGAEGSSRSFYPMLLDEPKARLAAALAIGACLATLDYFGSRPALYQLRPEVAAKCIPAVNKVLGAVRATTAEKDHSKKKSEERVVVEITQSPTPSSTAKLDPLKPERDQIQVLLTQTNTVPLIMLSEWCELVADMIVAFHLLLWSTVLAKIRFSLKKNQQLNPLVHEAGLNAIIAISLSTLWIPARVYSILEEQAMTGNAASLPAQVLAGLPIFVSIVFVLLLFFKSSAVVSILKAALALPIVLTIIGVYADEATLRAALGIDSNVYSLLAVSLVVGVLIFLIYSVLTTKVRSGVLLDDHGENQIEKRPDELKHEGE